LQQLRASLCCLVTPCCPPPPHTHTQRKRSSRLSAKAARRSGVYGDFDVAYPSSSRRASSGANEPAAAAAGGAEPLIQGVAAEALMQVGGWVDASLVGVGKGN
jgi:hypothetical protein